MANVLAYSVTGRGAHALLCLHGYLEDRQSYSFLKNSFDEKYKVICPDFPGHGGSLDWDQGYSIDDLSEAILEILAAEDILFVSILGHSMGGYVAIDLATKLKERAKHCVLINSHPFGDSDEQKSHRRKAIKIIGLKKALYLQEAVHGLVPDNYGSRVEKEKSLLLDHANQISEQSLIQALECMLNRDNQEEAFTSSSAKKIMIQAKQDPIIDSAKVQAFADEHQMDLKWFEGGHMTWLERPISLVRFLKKRLL